MLIRRANIYDAKRISYLIQKSTQKNPNNYSPEQLKTWKNYNTPSKIRKQIEERTTFCAFKNNRLIGTISLKENIIMGFYMSFGYRNKGLGSLLLKHMENYAISQKIKTLVLDSTPSAVNFYTQRGFEPKNEILVTLNGVNYKELKMKKTIQN